MTQFVARIAIMLYNFNKKRKEGMEMRKLLLLLVFTLLLVGCGSSTGGAKLGEDITLSGVVVIGEDLPAGAYDIRIKDDEGYSHIGIYTSVEQMNSESEQLDYIYVGGNDNDTASSYNLKDGTCVRISDPVIFTRRR